MISSYYLEHCKYMLGGLRPFIYILPKETTKIDYLVETKRTTPFTSKVEVKRIYYTNCTKIEGVKTTFNLEETVDNRLDFGTKVNLSLREDWGETWVSLLEQLKFMNVYVVVEDYNGNQYIQSPEFTSYFQYSYTFNSSTTEGNIAQITYSCDCNMPMVIINTKITPNYVYSSGCNYVSSGIKDFRMTPYQYVFINNDVNTGRFDNITCTGGEAMHKVEFIRNSFQFTQSYDGRTYKEKLVFRIPLSEYKFYFTYNLVEFQQNRYAIVFETMQENWIAAGFEHGMGVQYTIESSDDQSDLNTIEITLNHVGENSIFFCEEEPEILDSHTELFVPVSQPIRDMVTGTDLQYFHCISKTEAIYTLVQMVTESGVATDRYMCLNDEDYGDYRTYYEHFNIIGTYDKNADLGFELIFSNSDCAIKDNCKFTKMTKEVYSFSKVGDYYVSYIQNPCPWTLENIPNWINASRTSGNGGILYTVRFTSRENATDNKRVDIGFLKSFDNTSTIQFILEKKVDWIHPLEHYITAKAQTVMSYIDLNYSQYEICSIPDGVVAEKVKGTSTVRITVPQNDDETNVRVYEVRICRKDGESGLIRIYQDHLYVDWREDIGSFICVNGTSYKKVSKWIGYDAEHIDILTEEYVAGEKVLDNDPRCEFVDDGDLYDFKWVDADGTICIEETYGDPQTTHFNLYSKQQKWETFDGGMTWNITDEFQPNELLEEDSQECSDLPEPQYKMIVDYNDEDFYCDEETHTSYYYEYMWWSYDGLEWYKVDPEYKEVSTEVKQENDPECGGEIIVPGYNERWALSDKTYCKEGHLFYLEQKYISNDGGIVWTPTDEYREGSVDSGEECSDEEKHYVWRQDRGMYICDGTTSYYVDRYYYYYESSPNEFIVVEPIQIRKSEFENAKRQDNDPVCGYVDTTLYRWNTETGETICQGGNLYDREDYEMSTDNGVTWSVVFSRTGALIEEHSQYCPSVPTYTKYEIDYNRWVCDGTDSYYYEVQYQSTDNVYWVKTDPEVTQISNTIRLHDDPDCGSGGKIFRWVDDGDNTICDYADGEGQDTIRWIELPTSEYICDGYDKHKKEKQQSLINNVWTDTGITRQGSLIQANSTDCGYLEPVQEEWRNIDNSYICLGGNKYNALQRYYMSNGVWVTDGEKNIGSLIESNSTECDETDEFMHQYVLCGREDWECLNGYRIYKVTEYLNTDSIGLHWQMVGNECSKDSRGNYPVSCESDGIPQYRWVADTGYLCDCGNKYAKEKQQITYDSSQTWSDTGEVRKGQLIQEQSSDCESQIESRWVADGTMCDGVNKYVKEVLEVSFDNGSTWNRTDDTRKGTLIETNSTDCGYSVLYQWVADSTICVGTYKYNQEKQQVSYDMGETWEDVVPLNTRQGSLVQANSTDCGYAEQYVETSGYVCVGSDKYHKTKKQISTDYGETWTDASPAVYGTGTLIERNSSSCATVSGRYFTIEVVSETAKIVYNTSLLKPEYRINGGEWQRYTSFFTSPVGTKIEWRNNLPTNDSKRVFELTDGQVKVYGNINSLYEGDSTTTTCYHYKEFFYGDTAIISASGLILPATTLSDKRDTYRCMFKGCYNLKTPPRIDAIYMGQNSCTGMFQGCSALTTAPALPATTLASECYYGMFYGCRSLRTAPSLPATTLAYGCYSGMFENCSSLTTAPSLPATTLANYCYYQMFDGCTSLTTAPNLPATTLANYCYGGMFIDCTSLTTAPTLPATTLTVDCYRSMFAGCTNLSYIKCLATNNTSGDTNNWVNGVAASGTFVKKSGISWTTGTDGIPSGWTVQNA